MFGKLAEFIRVTLECIEEVYKSCYSNKVVSIIGVAIFVAAIPIIYIMKNDDFYYGKKVVDSKLQKNTVDPHFEVQNLEPILIFEVNRHGARTPYLDNPAYLRDFKVPREMLTPMGMR